MLTIRKVAIWGTAQYRKTSRVFSSRKFPSPSKTAFVTLGSFNCDCTQCLPCFDAAEICLWSRHTEPKSSCFTFNASCSQKNVMKSQSPWIWLPLHSQQFNFPALLFCVEAEFRNDANRVSLRHSDKFSTKEPVRPAGWIVMILWASRTQIHGVWSSG